MRFVDLSHVIRPGMVTYPGLPGPRPATEEPGRTEASLPAPPEADTEEPGENNAAAPLEARDAGPDETGPAAPTRPDQPGPARSAREARRARSRRAAADVPAEPDAADEWISLLTADPVDE